MWTCVSGKFPLFYPLELTMRCVHCKTTCVYITFRLTKTCICVTNNTTLCFPPVFPSIYHHVTFLLTNPFQYPTINIRNHVWVHWFDWCEGVLDLLNVKDVPLNKSFDLQDRVRVQILTCLYVTCHLITRVLFRLPRFHTNVSPTRRVHAHVRTLQDECLHTFWLMKTCLCVTFNIQHHLFHLTTHICSRNDVPPHDFNLRTLLSIQLLTHETMSEYIGFTDSKDSVHCKKTCLYATFWLTSSCACANFDTQTHDMTLHHFCVQFRT